MSHVNSLVPPVCIDLEGSVSLSQWLLDKDGLLVCLEVVEKR